MVYNDKFEFLRLTYILGKSRPQQNQFNGFYERVLFRHKVVSTHIVDNDVRIKLMKATKQNSIIFIFFLFSLPTEYLSEFSTPSGHVRIV